MFSRPSLECHSREGEARFVVSDLRQESKKESMDSSRNEPFERSRNDMSDIRATEIYRAFVGKPENESTLKVV